MPYFARLAAIVLPLALCAIVATPRPAAAEQPCSGTFCDFYYGGSSSNDTPAPQGAPTPVTVPSTGFLGRILGGSDTSPPPAAPGTTAPPAKKPMVAVQGGGLLGMMRGDAPERCSGTFCDLYYGGPPPEKPAGPPAAAAPDGGLAPEPAADQDAAPPPEERVRETVERREPEHCAAQGSDPWSCYRK